MPLTKQECYVAICDGCGYDFAGDFIPHFTNPNPESDLRDYDARLLTNEDGSFRVICYECRYLLNCPECGEENEKGHVCEEEA